MFSFRNVHQYAAKHRTGHDTSVGHVLSGKERKQAENIGRSKIDVNSIHDNETSPKCPVSEIIFFTCRLSITSHFLSHQRIDINKDTRDLMAPPPCDVFTTLSMILSIHSFVNGFSSARWASGALFMYWINLANVGVTAFTSMPADVQNR